MVSGERENENIWKMFKFEGLQHKKLKKRSHKIISPYDNSDNNIERWCGTSAVPPMKSQRKRIQSTICSKANTKLREFMKVRSVSTSSSSALFNSTRVQNILVLPLATFSHTQKTIRFPERVHWDTRKVLVIFFLNPNF